MKIVSSWPRFTLAVFFALGPVFVSSTVEAADLWARYVQITNAPADGMYSPGAQLDIRYGVHNEVGSPSPDFTISFYLSKDKSTDASAYLLGSLREDGLESWQVRDWTGSLTLPNDIPNGQYYLGMVVICSGDSNSANNVVWASAVIRVGVPGPDLSVQSVDATDGWYSAGEEIAVTVDVKNVGQLVSGGHSIECYACSDAQNTGSCRSLGSADFGPLPPGERITCAAMYRFPSPLPDGEYFIRAVVTCGGDNDVRDNVGLDNNKVHVGPHPDLAVQSVDAADGIYMPNGQIVVQTKICNVGGLLSAGYTVSCYVSTDATITARDYAMNSVTHGGLAPGEQCTHDITCRLPSYVPLGKCYIGVIVTCANDGRTANNVGVDAVPLTIVHPPGYVCGRVTYEDTSAWVHAIRYARVKIYNADNDNDPLNDRLLAQTSTDVDGNFGAVLVGDQTSGPQIYVKVFTEAVSGAYPGTTSTICTVKDDVLKALYALKSPLCPFPTDTSATVNLLSPKTAGEFMVYDSIVEGFHKTKVFFDAELDAIAGYWPSSDGGTYYWPGEGIWVARYDRGDRDVIMHEYGHYVADSHGFALGSVGLNPFHYWNLDLRFYPYLRTNEEAMNLAFRESWATLFAIAVQYGDTSYPYGGDAMYQNYDEVAKKTQMLNLETDTYPACSPGEFFDNMTACALWDMFDDQNDTRNYQDTLSDPGLVKIWSIVRDYKPMDTLDFWNSWFEEYDYRKEMLAIFGNHQINFKYPKGSGTVATFESGQLDGFAWTTKGDALWTVVSDASHQGTYSARSGSIEAGQSSTLEVTMTCESGRIAFWYKLSTEMGGDMLHFYIDGVWQSSWSGEKDWQRIDFAVQAGPRTFTWKYLKDGSLTRGADTVWLDDIEFPVW